MVVSVRFVATLSSAYLLTLPDGFTKAPGRPKPQAAHVLVFVARTAANTQSTNRFRPLTIADLEGVAVALPPRAPIGQMETVAVANVALQESSDVRMRHVSLQVSADVHTNCF